MNTQNIAPKILAAKVTHIRNLYGGIHGMLGALPSSRFAGAIV